MWTTIKENPIGIAGNMELEMPFLSKAVCAMTKKKKKAPMNSRRNALLVVRKLSTVVEPSSKGGLWYTLPKNLGEPERFETHPQVKDAPRAAPRNCAIQYTAIFVAEI